MKNTENSKLLLHHFLPNWERYLLMSIVPIYFMLISLTQQNPMSIFEGVREIIVQPDILITDYFVVGGVGAAFSMRDASPSFPLAYSVSPNPILTEAVSWPPA